MLSAHRRLTVKVRAAIAGIFICFPIAYLLLSGDLSITALSQVRRSRPAARAARPAAAKYSEFPHNVKAHRVECSNCHKFPSPNWNKVRSGDAAYPDITEYPRHESCINCHRQQFFKGARPAICSICHTNPSPRNSGRHPFPNPREVFDASPKGKTATTDFGIFFPHDKHVDIVAAFGAARSIFRNAGFTRSMRAEESCSVCHATHQPQGESDVEFVTKPPDDLGEGFWLKKGTFKAVPTGHTTCFTCHSQDSGIAPAPTDCANCHKSKAAQPAADFDVKLAKTIGVTDRVTLDLWRRRDSSGKFRHEWFSHAELSCSTCHNVQTMDTTVPQTKKVALVSCSTCHATATSEEGGALNLEIDARRSNPTFQCTKCHITFGSRPIPESHTKAIAPAAGN